MNKKHTYISLFSSSGVGCYGFKMENFECIATNELIERRLNIQKINSKCSFDSGYILGDIKNNNVKIELFNEINKWRDKGINVDVIIATPPCQGMSVANHKKKENEIERNSLVNESIDIIKKVKPSIFILENVPAFWKTGCIYNGKIESIGTMIMSELSSLYQIEHKVLNFKNYGANSSRTRTLIIGTHKETNINPKTLYPDYREEKSLFDVIGKMKSLDWGEYDDNDYFHSFRVYPEHMREWIKDLKEGESAFNNKDDYKKPHQIIDGKLIINQSKNGDKYTRQIFSKVAPCIHTRNDQLASQNTIHPVDDRVFSIRELMMMMNIPNSFKWINKELSELNTLSNEEKRKLSKKEEMNIRQSIGEAVPTEVFRQIAEKINKELVNYV